MTTTEELASVIEKMVTEQVSEQMKVLEDTYFAKSKQTIFTKAELASKWGCSVGTVDRILKEYHVNPIGKRGKEHEFDIEQAEEAKQEYNKAVLHQHELNKRAKAM